MAASPAPSKQRWSVAVEFMDGDTIKGASADDVIERWGRRLGWLTGMPLSAAEVKEVAARFARGFYGAHLPDGVESLDALPFLQALSDEKVLWLIVR